MGALLPCELGFPLGLADAELGDTLGPTDGMLLGFAVSTRPIDGLSLGALLTGEVRFSLGLADGTSLGAPLKFVATTLGDTLGRILALGPKDGLLLGAKVSIILTDGLLLGMVLILGTLEGNKLGVELELGGEEGCPKLGEKEEEGLCEGNILGTSVGDALFWPVG